MLQPTRTGNHANESCTMRIVGIDIAVADAGTAFCEGWLDADGLHVEQASAGSDDEDILKRMHGANRIGIDAPFGWPVAFVDQLNEYDRTGRWPTNPVFWNYQPKEQKLQRSLRLRATDRVVRARIRSDAGVKPVDPLSVSTQLIAGCAMRTAYLLTSYAAAREDWTFDRTGTLPNENRIYEVYPSATLACWGIDRAGYKGKKDHHLAAAARIGDELERRLGRGITFYNQARVEIVSSEHALDAFVAFLATAVASCGGSVLPGDPSTLKHDPDAEQLRREGWIHLPSGPLEDVALGQGPE